YEYATNSPAQFHDASGLTTDEEMRRWGIDPDAPYRPGSPVTNRDYYNWIDHLDDPPDFRPYIEPFLKDPLPQWWQVLPKIISLPFFGPQPVVPNPSHKPFGWPFLHGPVSIPTTPNQPEGQNTVTPSASRDPNDKVGPTDYVSGDTLLPYRIDFENDPS